MLHDCRNVQPDSDLQDKTGKIFSTKHRRRPSACVSNSLFQSAKQRHAASRTHVGYDGDEGVGNREREALWGSRLKAFLHQRETVFPTEEADISQQMQRNLHVLRNQTHNNTASPSKALVFHWVSDIRQCLTRCQTNQSSGLFTGQKSNTSLN